MATKLMAIRRPDTCAGCSTPLPPKTRAWWDSDERTVTCTTCQPKPGSEPRLPAGPQPLPPPMPIDHGAGGVSAQREYEKRAARHQRKRTQPVGSDVIGDVTPIAAEPQSVAAWAKGADGERRLAAHIDDRIEYGSIVLHDRAVPNTKGNIDHLIVASGGVWIVDAKNYAGMVERRVPSSRGDRSRLFVNGRNQTKLIDKMEWQRDAVHEALGAIGFSSLSINTCICFTNAEWSLFSRPFEIDDVWVGWPQALIKAIRRSTAVRADTIATVGQHLSTRFPAFV